MKFALLEKQQILKPAKILVYNQHIGRAFVRRDYKQKRTIFYTAQQKHNNHTKILKFTISKSTYFDSILFAIDVTQ